MAQISVKLNLSKLQSLADEIGGDIDMAVAAVAHQALGEAQVRCPVDTGALRASLHVEPKAVEGQRTLADGVEYGVYQEFGTSKMAAQPFMLPGILAATKDFGPEVSKAFEKAAT